MIINTVTTLKQSGGVTKTIEEDGKNKRSKKKLKKKSLKKKLHCDPISKSRYKNKGKKKKIK